MVPSFKCDVNENGTILFADYEGLCRFLHIPKSTKRIRKKRFKKVMLRLLKEYVERAVI